MTRRALAVALAAGVAGIALDLAGAAPGLRTVLVLFFLAVGPAAAVAGLLPMLDGFGRLVVSGAAAIVVLILLPYLMLMAGAWSPRGALLAVAGITAACAAAQALPASRRPRAGIAVASPGTVGEEVSAAGPPGAATVKAKSRRSVPAAPAEGSAASQTLPASGPAQPDDAGLAGEISIWADDGWHLSEEITP